MVNAINQPKSIEDYFMKSYMSHRTRPLGLRPKTMAAACLAVMTSSVTATATAATTTSTATAACQLVHRSGSRSSSSSSRRSQYPFYRCRVIYSLKTAQAFALRRKKSIFEKIIPQYTGEKRWLAELVQIQGRNQQ